MIVVVLHRTVDSRKKNGDAALLCGYSCDEGSMGKAGGVDALLWRGASKRSPAKVAVSPERISDLIGAIYDCVLDPGNWETTLDTINREFLFANSVLGLLPLRAGAPTANFSVGIDQEWLRLAPAYSAESVALWGGAELVQQFPLDEPIVASQTPGFADRHANRYLREILAPRGMHDSAVIAIARERALVGYVAFNRHVSAGPIGDADISGLRLLGPHFRRAVTISNLFDMKAIDAASFRSALDVLAFGVILVDAELKVVHANPAAEAMLRNADPIHSIGGSVSVAPAPANKALGLAVRQSADDEGALGQRGIGIPVRRKSGDPSVVHVMPLHRGEMRSGLVANAVAALFIVPADGPARLPIDALALLYDLTPAEVRVFELIGAGKTQAEIAAEIGVARSTVKTHLLHVFEKTGRRRQADLLKLAADLTIPA